MTKRKLKFQIGDAVTIPYYDKAIYMIVDYTDFSKIHKDNDMDVEFELMQIYPVEENSSFEIAVEEDLILHSKVGSVNNMLLHGLIMRERKSRGYDDIPDFIRIARASKDALNSTDKILYEELETIDKCLDAILDLRMLHELFEDEYYLDMIEKVEVRIRELQEMELMRKNG